jgi:hypothetical protein
VPAAISHAALLFCPMNSTIDIVPHDAMAGINLVEKLISSPLEKLPYYF